MTFQLFVIAGRSLMLRFFRLPVLRLRETVELISDAATGALSESRKAIEVVGVDGGGGGRHWY